MSYYIDVMPQAYSAPNWAYFAKAPQWHRPLAGIDSTRFAGEPVAGELFSQQEGPQAPTATLQRRETVVTPTATIEESASRTAPAVGESASDRDIQQLARQRVRLMAIKYAGGDTSEVLARLEILNRRLVAQAPRITRDQVEALERANEKLAQIKAAREERARRFGISVDL